MAEKDPFAKYREGATAASSPADPKKTPPPKTADKKKDKGLKAAYRKAVKVNKVVADKIIDKTGLDSAGNAIVHGLDVVGDYASRPAKAGAIAINNQVGKLDDVVGGKLTSTNLLGVGSAKQTAKAVKGGVQIPAAITGALNPVAGVLNATTKKKDPITLRVGGQYTQKAKIEQKSATSALKQKTPYTAVLDQAPGFRSTEQGGRRDPKDGVSSAIYASAALAGEVGSDATNLIPVGGAVKAGTKGRVLMKTDEVAIALRDIGKADVAEQVLRKGVSAASKEDLAAAGVKLSVPARAVNKTVGSAPRKLITAAQEGKLGEGAASLTTSYEKVAGSSKVRAAQGKLAKLDYERTMQHGRKGEEAFAQSQRRLIAKELGESKGALKKYARDKAFQADVVHAIEGDANALARTELKAPGLVARVKAANDGAYSTIQGFDPGIPYVEGYISRVHSPEWSKLMREKNNTPLAAKAKAFAASDAQKGRKYATLAEANAASMAEVGVPMYEPNVLKSLEKTAKDVGKVAGNHKRLAMMEKAGLASRVIENPILTDAKAALPEASASLGRTRKALGVAEKNLGAEARGAEQYAARSAAEGQSAATAGLRFEQADARLARAKDLGAESLTPPRVTPGSLTSAEDLAKVGPERTAFLDEEIPYLEKKLKKSLEIARLHVAEPSDMTVESMQVLFGNKNPVEELKRMSADLDALKAERAAGKAPDVAGSLAARDALAASDNAAGDAFMRAEAARAVTPGLQDKAVEAAQGASMALRGADAAQQSATAVAGHVAASEKVVAKLTERAAAKRAEFEGLKNIVSRPRDYQKVKAVDLKGVIDEGLTKLGDARLMGDEVYADPSIVQAMEKARALDAKEIPFMLRQFDKVQGLWKSQALLSPGFHVRNYMGGLFNNHLAGVDVHNYSIFAANYKRWEKGGLEAIPDPKIRTIFDSMLKDGTLGTTTGAYLDDAAQGLSATGRASSAVNPFSRGFKPYEWNMNAGQKVEDNLRGTLYLDSMLKGFTPEQAFDRVMTFHFDNAALSAGEKSVARRVVPFFSWARNNMALQFEQMARQPGKYSKVVSAQRGIENLNQTPEDKYVPEHFGQNMNTRLPLQDNGSQVYAGLETPFNSLLAPFQNFLSPQNFAVQNSSPIIQQAFATILDTNLKYGDRYSDENGNQIVKDAWGYKGILAKGLAKLPGHPLVVVAKDGTPMMTVKTQDGLDRFFPIGDRLDKFFSDDPKEQNRRLESVLSTFLGVSYMRNDGMRQDTERSARTRQLGGVKAAPASKKKSAPVSADPFAKYR